MRRPPRRQPQLDAGQRVLEIVCVVLVLVAVAALVAWIILNSGGGVLNQG